MTSGLRQHVAPLRQRNQRPHPRRLPLRRADAVRASRSDSPSMTAPTCASARGYGGSRCISAPPWPSSRDGPPSRTGRIPACPARHRARGSWRSGCPARPRSARHRSGAGDGTQRQRRGGGAREADHVLPVQPVEQDRPDRPRQAAPRPRAGCRSPASSEPPPRPRIRSPSRVSRSRACRPEASARVSPASPRRGS
jgi:hypothetical protein